MKVRELIGHKSLRAFNAFNSLVLGLKMVPAYASENYSDFLDRLEALPEDAQTKILLEAIRFVELKPDEVEAMISFCEDANGVPYGPENMKSLGPDQLVDAILSVSVKMAQMKIGLVSEDEKKKSRISALTSEPYSLSTPRSH